MKRLRRAHCWLTMHQMPDWPARDSWLTRPDGSQWRRRYCQRCEHEEVQVNV